MSIGSLGFVGVGAATPLAQSKGADVDRAAEEVSAQQGQNINEQKAEQAAGVGQADGEDHETEDRDADGRRLWELPAKKKSAAAAASAIVEAEPPHSRDPSGNCGTTLDLLG
jgi:hypothetical protein